MRFYFIRHGQSANNALWARTGSSQGRSYDPELTEAGQNQAAHVARFLATACDAGDAENDEQAQGGGFGLTHLYTSLMQRSVATGSIVAEALELPLVAWPDWHEHGGLYLKDEATGLPVGQEGPGRSYFTQRFPRLALPDELGDEGWWHSRPFEQSELRAARGQRVLAGLLERHGGSTDRVAVISHGAFYNSFLAALLGMSRRDCWFALNNTGITRVDFTSEGARIVYHNRCDHLPRSLLTD